MTAAEAVRELRMLFVQAMQAGATGDALHILETIREVALDGTDPVIELRIRRFRRLAGMRRGGNGAGPRAVQP